MFFVATRALPTVPGPGLPVAGVLRTAGTVVARGRLEVIEVVAASRKLAVDLGTQLAQLGDDLRGGPEVDTDVAPFMRQGDSHRPVRIVDDEVDLVGHVDHGVRHGAGRRRPLRITLPWRHACPG